MLTTQQPVYVTGNPQTGMDRALAGVDQRMSEMLGRFQQAMAERNAPLDSVHNYEATGKLCQNWTGTAPPKH